MKKSIFVIFSLIITGLVACSGNKADGSKNESYSAMDSTAKKDSLSGDTTKALDDSISNTPKLPAR